MPALLAAVALAGCGDGEQPAAAPDPDRPVSPQDADPAAPGAEPPASAKACARLGRRLVGEALPDATARAAQRRCPLRVAIRAGVRQALTEDFSPSRINVRVEEGVVTGVEFMG